MSTPLGPTVAVRTQNFAVFDYSPTTQLTPSRHRSGYFSSPLGYFFTKASRQQAYPPSHGRSLLTDLSESAPSITVAWSPRCYQTGKRIYTWLRLSISLSYKCSYVYTPLVSDTRGLVRGQLAYLY